MSLLRITSQYHTPSGDHAYYRSLRLLQLEAVVTGMMFAMPILTVFYKQEIGMSLAQIGLSQAVFTIPLLLLNIISGWIADTFSRRACNFFGDMLGMFGFVWYTVSTEFWHVIGAELVIGVGVAFSTGADTALMKAYADRLHMSYAKLFAQTTQWRTIGEGIAVGLGGIIGAYNPRAAIAMSAVTYGTGAVLSYFIIEAGDKRARHGGSLRATIRHAARDMAAITHYALYGHKPLAWRVIGYAISRTATHPLVWMLTPLMVMAGVPAPVIGLGWMLNLVAVWYGSRLAGRLPDTMTDKYQFSIGAIVFVVAAAGLSINVSLATIWLYAGFGFCRGWFGAIMSPIVQHRTPDDMQSTVMSVAGTVANAIYIPLVWGFSALGDISPQVSVLGNLTLFAPLLLIVAIKLRPAAR